MSSTKREVIKEVFRVALAKYPKVSATEAESMAIEFETTCYNAAISKAKESSELISRNWSDPRFLDFYSNRCGTVIGLVNPESISCKKHGTVVMNKVFDGSLKIEDIKSMTVAELVPESIADSLNEIMTQKSQVFEEKISTIHRCPRCGGYETLTKTVQLRSADEGSTVICRCVNPNCLTRFSIQN